MTMERKNIEKMYSPIKNGDFPWSCEVSGVYLQQHVENPGALVAILCPYYLTNLNLIERKDLPLGNRLDV